jgi:hypothetical protein
MNTELKEQSNILSLYVYPSPRGIDWTTPKSLVISTFLNTFLSSIGKFKHPLGHVSIRLNSEKNKINRFAGMARYNFGESRDIVLFQSAGLGTLAHNFYGRLEQEKDIYPDVKYNSKSGNVIELQFEIDDKAVININSFLDHFEKEKHYRNYGLPNDPLLAQGAGCSAFSVGLLKIAGIDFSKYENDWSDTVHIPNQLIGPHNQSIYHEDSSKTASLSREWTKVSILKLLFNKLNWGDANTQDTTSIFYYSPDKMFHWAKAFVKEQQNESNLNITINEFNNTHTIKFSNAQTNPTQLNWKIKNENNCQVIS